MKKMRVAMLVTEMIRLNNKNGYVNIIEIKFQDSRAIKHFAGECLLKHKLCNYLKIQAEIRTTNSSTSCLIMAASCLYSAMNVINTH